MTKHTLEPAAQEIADATSKPSFLYELGPDGVRKVLDDIQAAPIAKPDVQETWITGRLRCREGRGFGRFPAGGCQLAPLAFMIRTASSIQGLPDATRRRW